MLREYFDRAARFVTTYDCKARFVTSYDRAARFVTTHPRHATGIASCLCLIGLWLSGGRSGGSRDPEPVEIRQQAPVSMEVPIREAETRSAQAAEEEIAKVEAFFEEARTSIPAFAEAIVGAEGKLHAGNAVLEEGTNALSEVFGAKPVFAKDSFREYAERSFRQMVLDPTQLREKIGGSVNGWKSRAQEVRAELATAIGADLDDPNLDGQLESVISQASAADQSDAAIEQAIDVAVEDMFVVMGQFVASWAIGDAVEEMLTDDDTSFIERQLLGFVIGRGVDAAMDAAMKEAGRDPRSQLVGKVDALIARMRSLVIDGEPSAVGEYDALRGYGKSHPDASARAACSGAADTLLTHANLGLRRRLTGLHEMDVRAWKAGLGLVNSGPDMPSTIARDVLSTTPEIDAQAAIEFARSALARYGQASP